MIHHKEITLGIAEDLPVMSWTEEVITRTTFQNDRGISILHLSAVLVYKGSFQRTTSSDHYLIA